MGAEDPEIASIAGGGSKDGGAMKLKTRQSVRHAKFGWGTVLESDAHDTLVFFQTVGIKRLATSLHSFEFVEHVPPKKRLAA